MKIRIQSIIIVSVLVFGLLIGTANGQTTKETNSSQPSMRGEMMSGNNMMRGQVSGAPQRSWKSGCRGMMGSGMMSSGMMGSGMMGSGMMGSGMMGSGMMGSGMMGRMHPDQQQQFLDETKSLRKEMVGLRFDYKEAMRDQSTTPKDLAKIEKSILELRIRILETAYDSKEQ